MRPIQNCSLPFVLLLVLLSGLLSIADVQAASQCGEQARAQAERLLAFHVGPDDRISIRTEVEQLDSVPNPGAPEETLQHLEVWGDIYKGRYRMRFLYADVYDGCLLMGQSIMEFAELGLNSTHPPEQLSGIVRHLVLGDRACYASIELEGGQIENKLAVMTLCERVELLDQRVTLIVESSAVMAESCEGDPECPDQEWLELIVDAVPE